MNQYLFPPPSDSFGNSVPRVGPGPLDPVTATLETIARAVLESPPLRLTNRGLSYCLVAHFILARTGQSARSGVGAEALTFHHLNTEKLSSCDLRTSIAFWMATHWKGYILLLLLALYPIFSGAIDFSQCLADVITCANSSDCSSGMSNMTALSILRTSHGQIVTSLDDATALSYTGCVRYCGTGSEQFSWTSFAQDYAAWLLPYIALVSQLPFGAQRRMDNLMSAILTLGSPTLAGYALYMTLLNARWVNDQLFAGINYPGTTVRRSVVRALSSLQQVPLRVHPGESGVFESLVVHPDNDSWWTILAVELDCSHKWSIASAISITWVVIAYLLTVADSIINVPNNFESNGQGTGSGWLWLLPIVIGWLVLSLNYDYKRVYDAYRKANEHVIVADSEDRNSAPTRVTSNFGLTINPGPDWLLGRDITSPDELRIPPIFSYARTFSWYRNVYLASLFYRSAWRKSGNCVGVDRNSIQGNLRNDVPRPGRLGTRDEIIRYCRPNERECAATNVLWPPGLLRNMVVASLMALQLQWGTTGGALLVVWFTPTVGLGCRSLAFLLYGMLSTAVWVLLVSSSALGYYANHLLYDLPTSDAERDRKFTTPGATSKPPSFGPVVNSTDGGPSISPDETNFVIPLLRTRSPQKRESVPPESEVDTESNASTSFAIKRLLYMRQIYGQILLQAADWLRWIAKALAIVNAIGIIANSVLQYAGVYTNCYCDSSVYSWGASAFNVILPSSDDTDLARRAWIGGLALALSCCSFFVGSIYLVHDALPQ